MQNHEQCKEEMIELLTTVSEIMWSGGLLLLDMMHRGYLDELMTEDDEEYNKKVELLKRHKELFTGDLFGELTFIVITAKQNIEKLIGLVSANEENSTVELFKAAFVMYANHYRPWEVKDSILSYRPRSPAGLLTASCNGYRRWQHGHSWHHGRCPGTLSQGSGRICMP